MTRTEPISPALTHPRHGLLVACGLALGIAVAIGLARFAYALILPAMKADLAWSYTAAGSLNTTNAVGYLLGSYVAFRTVRSWGPMRPFVVGLWLTALTVILTGFVRDFYIISALRFMTGVTSAYVFVAGSVLAASVFPDDPRRAATAIAIYFAGGGLGLLISGLVLPWLLAHGGDPSWPQAWLTLGILSCVGSLLATLAARATSPPAARAAPHPWRKAPFTPMFLAYGCFALGYFAYMTFIVALLRQHGFDAMQVAAVWSALGLSSLIAQHVWGRPMATWRGGNAQAGILAAIGVGAALPVFYSSFAAMILSAALFGMFFMVPASVTAFVKKTLAPVVWGEAVAAFTVFFSILQCGGPILTGVLADLTDSLAAGLGASAGILLLGAALALLQREPQT
jgi:predicted MFS family arabinose efflux permease